MNQNMNIEGKVIVITGASSGLGEATAKLLSSRGATLILAARREDRIQFLADELKKTNSKVLAIKTDVSQFAQVQHLVDTAVNEFGQVDVIINNAGVMPLSLLEQCKVEEWDQMIDINIKGVLYGVAAVLPYMTSRKRGHIINVASTAGHRVMPTSSVYSATKYAVRALSEGLRQEVTPYNIRTTIISPGASSTGLLDGISDSHLQHTIRESASAFSLPPDAFARMVLFAIEQPEEVDVNEILFRPTSQEK